MAQYGKKSQASVKSAVHKQKRGQLKSGKSGQTVQSRRQAVAIGLSEARKKGAKVPAKKTASRGTGRTTTRSAASRSKKA